MKKLIIFTGLLLCAGLAFAADVQTALKETAEQFSASLKPKSIVAIIGIHSESPALSDFMLDELTLRLVQLKKLTIADRANLEAIKKEMSFQLSGEVGDESIQQLGAKIGAETVIQGTLKQVGSSSAYALTIRALNVTTAQVTDIYRENVELSRAETRMLGEATAAKKPKAQYNATSVGFQNLLFGLGSYRVGHYGDGAVLTVGHLAGLGCLFAGAGVYVDADSNIGRLRRGSVSDTSAIGGPYHSHEEFMNAQKRRQEKLNEQNEKIASAYNRRKIGIVLMAVGGAVELGSIIYGFVAPAVRNKHSNAYAAHDTGFKFNLAYTSSGNIAPQISYKIRY